MVQGQLVAFVSVINRQVERRKNREAHVRERERKNPTGERDAIHAREINQM
jgi:hypothetical protein